MWLGLTNHFDILTIRDISDSRYISNRDIVVQLYSKLCISNTLRECHHIIISSSYHPDYRIPESNFLS